jgi:hypothetical protein
MERSFRDAAPGLGSYLRLGNYRIFKYDTEYGEYRRGSV